MNLRTLLDSMRRYWRTCAAVGVSVAVIGLVAVLLMPTRYQSTVRLMVTISGATTATAYQNDDVVASRVNSYIALLTSEVVSQRVVDRLGLQADAADLAGRVSAARVPPNTSLIDVAVTADSPVEARLLADTVAQEFITYTRALETPTGQDDQKVRVSAVAAASEPRGDLTVRTLLALLVVLAAVLLAAVAAWVRAVTDPLVRTAQRAEESAAAPVLGDVVTGGPPSAQDVDGYRRLRMRLWSLPADVRRVIAVVPAGPGVDASDLAANLRDTLCHSGIRSIMVNSSGQRCSRTVATHDDFCCGRHAKPDPADAAVGAPVEESGGTSDSAASPAPVQVITTPEWVADPDLVLREAPSLIDRLRTDYECVVVATPVATGVTASALVEYADGVVLAASDRHTTRTQLRTAAHDLRATGAPILGVVLTRPHPPWPDSAENTAEKPELDQPPESSTSPSTD
ncbi:hypothetical protein [Mycolicibacterium confluentis]|uniref:Uncharacterized protein n=1 Tax=Mycolicibacterium confluentis TaxID=28047 RepID=A0A7I7Y174_9MYCO|nr:hypothetical protein [Mycolicibacterium confluentis]MCV7319841.1 hypothetical protein [Mycolicibacterium confluentis]ORV34415.1 hypothetical protein AWB99_01995 [Mycolicibacterium confluentis]BBZ34871.1 hypothetical protein MCNF_34760 [Mycolicibacterium confluentis]